MSSKKHIQYFPSEILNKIFSYVDDKDMCNNVPFVCEKWKLASSHSLQMKSNAFFEGKSLSSKEICFVLGNSPSLDSVTLVSCKETVPILRHISRCNTNLKKLILKECSSNDEEIPEEVMINMLCSLPELSAIELYDTKFKSDLFYELVASRSNITSIDLSLNEFVTLSNLMKLVHNSHITELKISRRLEEPRISDEEMSHMIRVMSSRVTLLHLDMGGLGASAYQEILCCSKLVDLKLNNAINLTINVLMQFPQLRKIRHLCIEGPSQALVKGDIYNSLFLNTNYGTQLEGLELHKFDSLYNVECCNIIKACPNLKVFSLMGCRCLTLRGIVDQLLEMKKLNRLNIAFLGELSNEVNFQELTELRDLVIDEESFNKIKIFKDNKELNLIKIKQLLK